MIRKIPLGKTISGSAHEATFTAPPPQTDLTGFDNTISLFYVFFRNINFRHFSTLYVVKPDLFSAKLTLLYYGRRNASRQGHVK